MRTFALTALAALALAAPSPARAQDPGDLPADLARRATAVLNDPQTRRYEGDAEIGSGDVVEGDVAVLDGSLALGGRVDGDVVVVNGALHLAEGAEITGDVLVIGGDIAGQDAAAVGGEMVVFAEPVSHCRRGDAVDVSGDCSGLPEPAEGVVELGVEGSTDGWETAEDERVAGRARLILAAGRSYNRVEGLPIKFGPEVTTAGSNPFRLRALAVFRTEDRGPLGPERWGYDARIEQFLGGHRELRLGVRAFSVVDPIESWHLTDLENSLATFFLHQDFRDHYLRRGWTAYATVEPRALPVSATLEYRRERHASMEPGSPWALFRNEDPWRPQPLVAQGRLNSVAAILRADSRSEDRDPATGWYVRGEVEKALRSDLLRPAATAAPRSPQRGGAGDVALPLPDAEYDGRWIAGTIDIRRYNRISPSSRLNLRLAGGASINGRALPPQRQHALGGEGSLPGYPLFALDCGARDVAVSEGTETEAEFYPRYGCDGFGLLQAEYRGEMSFRVDLGGPGPPDEAEGDDDEDYEGGGWAGGYGIHANFGWALFVDAGRGWKGAGGYDEPTLVDVGAGVLLDDVGIYVAVPVAGNRGRGGLNFFIRLAPRF